MYNIDQNHVNNFFSFLKVDRKYMCNLYFNKDRDQSSRALAGIAHFTIDYPATVTQMLAGHQLLLHYDEIRLQLIINKDIQLFRIRFYHINGSSE